jgi:phosphoadenosine phosphosulfate reductase
LCKTIDCATVAQSLEGDMGLTQLNFEGQDKIQFSIEIIQAYEPAKGYDLKMSGGKDSVALMRLADMAKSKYTPYYNQTGIDPPEVPKFIKEYYPQVIFIKPKFTMWEGIERKGLPTRLRRWCCQPLKHSSNKDTIKLTGIRAAESNGRRKQCFKSEYDGETLINPMFLWSDNDVWDFIRQENIPYCSLYDNGFKRIGCILCPLGRKVQRHLEANRYPKFVAAYKRASLRHAVKMGDEAVETHNDYFNRWLNG